MIDKIIKQLNPLINGKLIYLSQYGSHLYGLNTENSDLDFRGVYIPTLDDIILGKAQDEINTELTVTMFLRQKKLIDHTFEESDYELSKMMIDYYSNFIKSTNPNGNHLPTWKAVSCTHCGFRLFDGKSDGYIKPVAGLKKTVHSMLFDPGPL